MSAAVGVPGGAGPLWHARTGLLLALIAAALSGLMAWINLGRLGPGLAGMDPDSAMRLVQVRDLLGGQGWFDLVQHRLGLGGVEMHWSRLVDGPLAALILLGDLVGDRGAAERAALVAWPTAWLGVTLWATLALAHRLGGRFAAAVALLNLFAIQLMMATFYPGRIDHHNVQMALIMLAAWGFAARQDGRAGATVAGLCAGTSLVVGTELLPLMAALCCVVAGTWVAGGRTERDGAVLFGAALAGSMTAGFLLAAPASAWAGGYCDAVAMDMLLPVAGGGVLLAAVAATLSEVRPALRLGALGAGGAVLLSVSFVAFPACLSNPLDRLDPLLVRHWLSLVSEAQGLAAAVEGRHGIYFATLLLVAAGAVPVCVGLILAGQSRPAAVMLVILCAVATGFAAFQIRYMPFAVVLGMPGWAALIAHLRQRSQEGGGALCSAAAAGVLLLASSHVLLVAKALIWPQPAGAEEAGMGTLADCVMGNDLDRLSGLPPGRVASTSNLGAYLLLRTPHEAISAPYHRNQAGMLAQIGVALSASSEEAARRLREAGADYLILCGADPELGMVRASPEEEPLLLRVARGEVAIPGYPTILETDEVLVLGAARLP